MNDNLAEEDELGKWHIDYCYWEEKPNPEAANEKIPQTTMIKAYPDGWYKTGEFDYDESQYMKFLKEDPRCPYGEDSGKLFLYEDDPSEAGNEYTLYPRWACSYKYNAVSDAVRGDVLHLNHYHDWCWNNWGWRIAPGIGMFDSFRYHIWVKWTGDSIPWGYLWLRRRSSHNEFNACPRGEWCELDVSIEGFDWGYYSQYYQTSWSSAAYFEIWGTSYTNSEFWFDPGSIYGCAYDSNAALAALG